MRLKCRENTKFAITSHLKMFKNLQHFTAYFYIILLVHYILLHRMSVFMLLGLKSKIYSLVPDLGNSWGTPCLVPVLYYIHKFCTTKNTQKSNRSFLENNIIRIMLSSRYWSTFLLIAIARLVLCHIIYYVFSL